jgi:hypothetical protein
MKRIFFIIALAISCLAIHAAQSSNLQKKAKSEIFSALKQYGKNIHDSDEETIEFQYEGATYIASVGEHNTKTLYLGLAVMFSLPEGYQQEIANIAAFNAAGGKPVCSAALDGVLMFSCEMYAKEAKPFIAVMPEMLQALSSSVISFQDEYDKALKEYKPLPTSSVTGIDNDGNTFIYPKFKSNGDSKLYIEKVVLDSNYTVLDMVSYNGQRYQWCSISKNSYISVNGKRYTMTKAENVACAPLHTDYPGYDSGREVSLHFKLYFPAIPKETTSFDFSEGSVDGWNIKGVDLKHGNAYAISGERVETAYHKWDCTGIEVQDDQTIVTKVVQPKSEGTFMCSSQDEFIEDADTGRKYYLQNSSIGFEGSPIISHDTTPITFYEIYPVLPSNVKRINISSGSQYYVKDLKIR